MSEWCVGVSVVCVVCVVVVEEGVGKREKKGIGVHTHIYILL